MSTTVSTKRSVGYLRVSSPGQTGERHSSLDTQKAHFAEYCQRFDLLPEGFNGRPILTAKLGVNREEYTFGGWSPLVFS
jgi:hypothetical protein